MNLSFPAYRRADGRVGVRNHVLLLPAEDAAISVCQSVSALVPGTLPAAFSLGRDQFDADEDMHFQTLIGLGSNPNVAAVIVVGYKKGWTERVVKGIAPTGKPVAGFSIDGVGDIATAAAAARTAQKFLQDASELPKTPCQLSDLCVASKCGETDVTSMVGAHPALGDAYDKLYAAGTTLLFGEISDLEGGMHFVLDRAIDDTVRAKIRRIMNNYLDDMYAHNTLTPREDLLRTPDVARKGLTTLEERTMGSLQKIGKNTRITGALDKGCAPDGPGLWFMDSASSNAEMMTLAAASGCTAILCATGSGGGSGNIITPVIKITANPATAAALSDQIDVDVSALTQGKITVEQAGDLILQGLARTAAGRLTAAETMGHREMYITRLHQSL